jgi:hypothetical protein
VIRELKEWSEMRCGRYHIQSPEMAFSAGAALK